MPQPIGRAWRPLALLVLTTASLTGCSIARPPSASGLCPAIVPEVVVMTPDERAATPASVKRKVARINAAVLGACGGSEG